jgi:hypothetical protein
MEITQIQLGHLIIHEPVTVITDLLVTAVCWYASWKMRVFAPGKLKTLFQAYFFTMGLATAYGGIIGHGFIQQLGFAWKVPGWLISMFSVALLERAAIFHAKPWLSPEFGRFMALLNLLELFVLIGVVLFTLNFFFVEAHAAYGLLVVVASLEGYIYHKTKHIASKKMLLAIGIAALAACVHLSEFAPHTWFNHLDLSHVLMAISSWYIFQACSLLLPDAAEKAT